MAKARSSGKSPGKADGSKTGKSGKSPAAEPARAPARTSAQPSTKAPAKPAPKTATKPAPEQAVVKAPVEAPVDAVAPAGGVLEERPAAETPTPASTSASTSTPQRAQAIGTTAASADNATNAANTANTINTINTSNATNTEKAMKEPSIGIAREGWPAIFITGLGAVVFAMMGCAVMATIFFVLCWFSLGFFRDPERVVPDEQGIATSPADGRIVKVERREAPLDGGSCLCVSIFMNVFNVHVNRAPVDGTLEKIAYHPGKFLNASLDKASTDNERCAYQMRDRDGKAWTFVQIAGLVARRIVCRADRGDELARGARFGLIRFGSRVDLYLPDGYIPAVSVGETVLAGQTVIARRMTPDQADS